MLNLPIHPKHSLAPALVLLLACILYLFEPTSSHYLAFDRDKIQSLQWWRLLSGNFLHTNLNHLLLNACGLALLWALHGQYFTTKTYLIIFLLTSLSCTLGIYFFAERLSWYVGLSGTLHGLFVLGAYKDIRAGLKSGWLLLLGVWAKIAYEQGYGGNKDVAELIGASVAIEAHLYGALSGMLLLGYFLLRSGPSLPLNEQK
jgi:rhomboid family GlyGly-CTERM serine protease